MLLRERFAVLDFETNGHSASHGGEVVETGVVRLEQGRPARSFHALTRPLLPIPSAAVGIHGITDEMVCDQPRFAEVLPGLLDFVGDRIVVAHNAPFDRSYLDAATKLAGRGVIANPFLDTLRLSRALCPQLDRHDLESLCVHHRIPREVRHRALPDARATARLLRILLEHAAEAGIGTVEKLLAVAGCARGAADGPSEITIEAAEQELLEAAVITGDRLVVRYETRTGGVRPAVIVPYQIDCAHGLPRLVAFDLERDRARTFRLDRLISVQGADSVDPAPGGSLS